MTLLPSERRAGAPFTQSAQVRPRPPAKKPRMNIMLTGPRGAGKSTIVMRIRNCFLMFSVGGYVTESIGDPADPKGHVMHPFGKKSRSIAHVNSKKGPRVGRFRVNVEAFEKHGVAALQHARERPGIIFLDEIGRFEVHAPKFVAEIERCLDCANPVLGVLSAHGGPVVEAVTARDDVRLVAVEEASRDLLPAAIMGALALEMQWRDDLPCHQMAGVILAGGEGSRLSPAKGWLEVGGRPIVERVRDMLGEICAHTLVAGPPEVGARLGLDAVEDAVEEAGPLAGIAGALVGVGQDLALVCAWDMPFADGALGLHMLMLAEEEGFDAVAPRTERGAEPLFTVYRNTCLSPALELLAAGERRPLALLEKVNTRWVEGPELAVFGDPATTLMSVNTPEDLSRAEALAGEEE